MQCRRLRRRRELVFQPQWNGSRSELLQQLHQRRIVTQVVSRSKKETNKKEEEKLIWAERINFHRKKTFFRKKEAGKLEYEKVSFGMQLPKKSLLLRTQIVWVKNEITRRKRRKREQYKLFLLHQWERHGVENLFFFPYFSPAALPPFFQVKFSFKNKEKKKARVERRQAEKKVMQI